MPQVPLVKSPHVEPPRTTYDTRVGDRRRMMKGRLQEARGIAEVDVSERSLKEYHWSNSIRDDILRVVAGSERETGH